MVEQGEITIRAWEPRDREAVEGIDLTANDREQAGHALYRSLGFRARDTRSFRLPL
jgi:hypothetical protein